MNPIRNKKFEREFARFQKNFGIVVRDLRLKTKLSQRELAKRAKLDVSTLVSIEEGRANPMLSSMENLAMALNHRLSYLFKLTQDRE